MMAPISADLLRELLHYDPETGLWTWLVSRGKAKKGKAAGNYMPGRDGASGYWQIALFGKRYLAHRLAVLYMTGEWPKDRVDHEDLDGLNNRWTNLRQATSSQNQWNTGVRRHNTSGFKGVSLDRRRGRWVAQICIHGQRRNLGSYSTPEEAGSRYEAEARVAFGEFARLS